MIRDFSKPDNRVTLEKAYPKKRADNYLEHSNFNSPERVNVTTPRTQQNEESLFKLKGANYLMMNSTKRSRNKDTIQTATNVETDINEDDKRFETDRLRSSSKKNSVSNGGGSLKTTANNFRKKKSFSGLGQISQFIFGGKNSQFKGLNFEDTKHYEFLHTQYLINCSLQCIFSILSILCAIIEYESTVLIKEDGKSVVITDENSIGLTSSKRSNARTVGLTASVFCLVSSVLLWMTIIFDHYINCKLLQHSKKLSEEIWKRDKSMIMELMITLVVFTLHPNPMTYNINIISYNEKFKAWDTIPLNSYFVMICFLRLWFILKFYIVSSVYYDPRTQRVCEMNSFDTSIGFSLKSIMVRDPYLIYTLLFMGILFYCSYGIRIFERGLDSVSGANFTNYYNCLWCVFITMTTVGYGDMSPASSFGRFFIIIGCFFGVFLISMLVVAVTNILNLVGNEQNIYLVLERADLMAEKDTLAAKLLTKYVNIIKSNKSNETKAKQRMRDDMLFSLHEFRENCKQIDSTFPAYSNFDNIIDNLTFLEKAMKGFDERYKHLNNVVAKIAENIAESRK